jgi:hypothetical protein
MITPICAECGEPICQRCGECHCPGGGFDGDELGIDTEEEEDDDE